MRSRLHRPGRGQAPRPADPRAVGAIVRAVAVAGIAAAQLCVAAACPGSSEPFDPCAAVTCAPGRVCVDGRCQASCLGGDCAAQGGDGWHPGLDAGDGPGRDGPAAADVGPNESGVYPDHFLKPEAGPSCGDSVCNNGETCLDCPGDCGKCPCTPGQSESSGSGCAPCWQMTRSCQADGQWGAWSACADTCSASAPVCVNGQCKACSPGSSEQQACPCGSQTRTCDGSGAWGAWGSCVTTCSGVFTCISDRCAKEYTAYPGAGGGECGYIYSGGVYTYQLCQPGDLCVSSSKKLCRKYEVPQPGDIYSAASAASGPECGYTYSGGVYTYFKCLPGDLCKSSSQKQCAYVGTACGAIYNAFASAAGPVCGYRYSGGVYTYFKCLPGDYCSSSSQKECKIVTTCPAGALYHAYVGAGGPQCGSTYSGGVYTYYTCKPLDTCTSTSQKLCKQ